jgi:hypothetical protein
MEKPEFPAIIIDRIDSLSIASTELDLETTRASVIFNGTIFNNRKVFDCQGSVWSFHLENKELKEGFIRKLIAKTLYDPLVSAKVVWEKKAYYELKDLKESLYEMIEKDDDVLTQYFEAETLKLAVSQVKTFLQLISMLNQYIFEVDEYTLWNLKKNCQ